jgi:hypothetical protein
MEGVFYQVGSMLTERAARPISNHPTLAEALAACEGDPSEVTAVGHKGVRPWVCRVSEEGRRIEAWLVIHGEQSRDKGLTPAEAQAAAEWVQRRVDVRVDVRADARQHTACVA